MVVLTAPCSSQHLQAFASGEWDSLPGYRNRGCGLQMFKVDEAKFSAPGHVRRVLAPRQYLSSYLPALRVSFGRKNRSYGHRAVGRKVSSISRSASLLKSPGSHPWCVRCHNCLEVTLTVFLGHGANRQTPFSLFTIAMNQRPHSLWPHSASIGWKYVPPHAEY